MACNGPEGHVEGGGGCKLHVDELIRHTREPRENRGVRFFLSIPDCAPLSFSHSRRKIMHTFSRIPSTGEGQKERGRRKGASGRVARAHVLL